ncbi:LysE family transporter [Paenibacillus sp. GCM10023252]|uniref:LysE family transporter n=1 Tax=Paenibacillus sp. GCM10023252 TaxID=3252649 RepID=UPI0036216022
MSMLLSYILLGLSLAAPIGPINAAQMDRGIRGGFWNSWLLGLGSMLADVLFILIVYFGTVHFLDHPVMNTFLWVFGCFVLIYTGIDGLKGAAAIDTDRQASSEPLSRSFGTGFLISLLNPLTIMFWLGIYGSVLAKTAKTYETPQLIMYTLAILLGIGLWDLMMAITSSYSRRLLRPATLTLISRLSGLSLIGFGLYFGWQALQELV